MCDDKAGRLCPSVVHEHGCRVSAHSYDNVEVSIIPHLIEAIRVLDRPDPDEALEMRWGCDPMAS